MRVCGCEATSRRSPPSRPDHRAVSHAQSRPTAQPSVPDARASPDLHLIVRRLMPSGPVRPADRIAIPWPRDHRRRRIWPRTAAAFSPALEYPAPPPPAACIPRAGHQAQYRSQHQVAIGWTSRSKRARGRRSAADGAVQADKWSTSAATWSGPAAGRRRHIAVPFTYRPCSRPEIRHLTARCLARQPVADAKLLGRRDHSVKNAEASG